MNKSSVWVNQKLFVEPEDVTKMFGPCSAAAAILVTTNRIVPCSHCGVTITSYHAAKHNSRRTCSLCGLLEDEDRTVDVVKVLHESFFICISSCYRRCFLFQRKAETDAGGPVTSRARSKIQENNPGVDVIPLFACHDLLDGSFTLSDKWHQQDLRKGVDVDGRGSIVVKMI